VFFFFQAEDGIRDDLVTGVQTCALPILISQILQALDKVDKHFDDVATLELQAMGMTYGLDEIADDEAKYMSTLDASLVDVDC